MYITLKGDWGASIRQKLRKLREKSGKHRRTKLEPGSTRLFYVVSPDLGDIKSVVIEVCDGADRAMDECIAKILQL